MLIELLPLMPSPALIVAANVSNVKAVVVRLSKGQGLKSNPADFVITFFSEGQKLVGLGERVFDCRLVGIFFRIVKDIDLSNLSVVFFNVAFLSFKNVTALRTNFGINR